MIDKQATRVWNVVEEECHGILWSRVCEDVQKEKTAIVDAFTSNIENQTITISLLENNSLANIKEQSNLIDYTKKLLTTPGVSSIVLSFNSKKIILTSDDITNNSIYSKLQELVDDMTSTSSLEKGKRKISSLYKKSFNLTVNLDSNSVVKGKNTNSITYTTNFKSDYIVTNDYWKQFSTGNNSVMAAINNNYEVFKDGAWQYGYVITPPGSPKSNIIKMEYHSEIAGESISSTAYSRGFKTAFFRLLGNTSQNYPETAIQKLTLEYVTGSDVYTAEVTPDDIRGSDAVFIAYLMFNVLPNMRELTNKQNQELNDAKVNLKFELKLNWAVADDFEYPLDYVVQFGLKEGSKARE